MVFDSYRYMCEYEKFKWVHVTVSLMDVDKHGVRNAPCTMKIYLSEQVNGYTPVIYQAKFQQAHRAFEKLVEDWCEYDFRPTGENADEAPEIMSYGVMYR